jgi:hypothetical protein
LVCRRHAANPLPEDCLTCMIAEVENLPKRFVEAERRRLIKLPVFIPQSVIRNPKSGRVA